MLNLTDFLNTTSHPHTAEIPVGGGAKLAVTFRAVDPARAQAAILAATGAGLTALGLDPMTTLKAAAGQLPKGEAAKTFPAAIDALEGETEAEFIKLMQLADGAGLADVIGSFEAILPGGKREAVAESVTPEVCAALPADVKKAILAAVATAEMPVEALGLLGKSASVSSGAVPGSNAKIPH